MKNISFPLIPLPKTPRRSANNYSHTRKDAKVIKFTKYANPNKFFDHRQFCIICEANKSADPPTSLVSNTTLTVTAPWQRHDHNHIPTITWMDFSDGTFDHRTDRSAPHHSNWGHPWVGNTGGDRRHQTPAANAGGTCPHQICKLDVASNGEQRLNPM